MVRQYLSLILVFYAGFSGAQNVDETIVPIHRMVMHQWTGDDGLISNNLTSVIQSNDGFIWITSFNGAHRFDGKEFKLFDKENIPSLKSNAFYQVYQAQSNQLYFSSQGTGLIFYDGEQFSINEELGDLPVRVTHEDSYGRLWCGTNNAGLYVIDGADIEQIEHELFRNTIINDVLAAPDGDAIWVATNSNGLIKVVDDRVVEHFDTMSDFPDRVNALISVNNSLAVGTEDGIYLIKGSSIDYLESTKGLDINALVEHDNMIWIGSERGLGRIAPDGSKFEIMDERGGLPSNQISGLAFDHEGSLWASTKKAGLLHFNIGNILNITKEDGLLDDEVNIVAENNGATYIGGDDGSIVVLDSSGSRSIRNKAEKLGLGIRDFAFDNDVIWAASYAGLHKFQNDSEIVLTRKEGLPSNDIRRVFKDSKGKIWAASRSGGLSRIVNDKVEQVFDTFNGLDSDYVLAVEENKDGQMVVGTHSGGLTFIDGDSTNTYYIPGFTGALFFNITIDKNNNYWLTTNVGLFLFRHGEFLRVKFQTSFKTETFFDMVIDNLGNCWLTTNVGIVWVNGEELNSYANGEIGQISASIYDNTDGMRTRECTGATRSLLAADGKIWVPTLASVAVVDPQNIKRNLAVPNVVITDFLIGDSTLSLNNPVVEPGFLRYQIKFATLSYLAPKKVKFKYLLKGVDRDWVEVSDMHKVEYTNLAPGDYEFQVIGANNDGVWNEQGARFEFKILPFFYQTTWFYIAAALALIAMLWFLFQWRLTRVRIMNNRLTKVNEELDRFVYSASHDLRAPLASVLGLVRISRLDETKEGKDECLTLIEKSVNKLDHFITDIIDYSRNQRQDLSIEPIDIKEEISQLINELKHLDENDKISISIESEVGNINTDKRRLLIVLKNLISNAYVYFDPNKEASFIKIHVTRRNNSVIVAVSDNGLGIHRTHIESIFKMFYRGREDSRGSGLGLYIVAETMEKLGGKVSVESEVGIGSSFQLLIPE